MFLCIQALCWYFLNNFKMHYLWEFEGQNLLNKLCYGKVSSAEKEGEVLSTKFWNIFSLYLRSLCLCLTIFPPNFNIFKSPLFLVGEAATFWSCLQLSSLRLKTSKCILILGERTLSYYQTFLLVFCLRMCSNNSEFYLRKVPFSGFCVRTFTTRDLNV